jgi:hypothetical protein
MHPGEEICSVIVKYDHAANRLDSQSEDTTFALTNSPNPSMSIIVRSQVPTLSNMIWRCQQFFAGSIFRIENLKIANI